MAFTATYMIPAIICLAGALMFFSKNDLFSEFLAGAREGLDITLSLLPTLILLLCSISMFTASGALTLITRLCGHALTAVGISEELIGLIVLRPVSGSASTAIAAELLQSSGADSSAGLAASVILGSSDTVIYVLSVYFSAVKTKKTRYAFAAAFITQILCVFLSSLLARFI